MRQFRESISYLALFVDIWNIIFFVLGAGSGGGAVLTYLKELPIIYPLVFGVLSVGMLVFATIHTIILYKRSNNPGVMKLIKTLHEMHYLLKEESKPIPAQKVSWSILKNISFKTSEMFGVTRKELILRLAKQEKYTDYMLKTIRKIYSIKERGMLSLSVPLYEYSLLLDKWHIGIGNLMEKENYRGLDKVLNKYELELTNVDASESIINARNLSKGLISLWVGVKAIENNHAYFEYFPSHLIDTPSKLNQHLNDMYTLALLELKGKLIKG